MAVLALGAGIGVNTSVFSTADVLLFRNILAPDLERAVAVSSFLRGAKDPWDTVSPADFLEWKEQARSTEALCALIPTWGPVEAGGEEYEATGYRVSADLFDALGARPALGRVFLREEETPGRNRVAVLSRGFWVRRFGADPDAIHRKLRFRGERYEVIGVMGADFHYPARTDFWTPLALSPRERSERRSNWLLGNQKDQPLYMTAVGRLRAGVSLEQMKAEMDTIASRLGDRFPETNANRGVKVEWLREAEVEEGMERYTLLMMGAALFVLLITCANVASLEFARVSARSQEIAVRQALGAGRWRLARQFLAETLLRAALGAAVAVLIAQWTLDLIRAAGEPIRQYVPEIQRLRLNTWNLAYTVGLGALAGVLAGLAPAILASRAGFDSARPRHRFRSFLVTVEVALALVLLAGGDLMLNGFRGVAAPAPRLEPAKALTFSVPLSKQRYPQGREIAAFQEKMLLRLVPMPGVEFAALVTGLPYESGGPSAISIEGWGDPRVTPIAQVQSASPDYFRAMRIPLLRGRVIDRRDGPDAELVVLIAESLARRYFGGLDPIGRRVKAGPAASAEPWLRVVGVVGDVRQNAYYPAWPMLYRPAAQEPPRSFDVLIRVAGDAGSMAGMARAVVRDLDPDQPVLGMMSFERRIAEHLLGIQSAVATMGIFGVLALALACLAVYSVMAWSVTERVREIGIRVAVGAGRGDVLRMMAALAVRLTLWGVALGLAAAMALARLLGSLMWEIPAWDPAAFTVGAAVLAVAVLAASVAPALRATRIDPAVALRSQ